MMTRGRGIARSSGLIWLAAIAVIVAIGCGGYVSPLLSLQFASLLGGRAAGGGSQPATQGTGTTTTLRQSCDLDANKRGIFVVLENQAQQFVRYSVTFVASAGPGGFVCASDENTYFNAGYRDTVLDANGGRGATIGCDIVQLLGGTRLLTFRVKNNMPQNIGGTSTPPIAQIPLNGNTFIPLPELIVLGDGETETNGSKIFTCTGNDLCTQRGFIYTDVANTPIAFVNASRTQDTVCNSRAGTAPEWRLTDINKADNQASPFQYPPGGTIILVVLDRASNVNANVNQVIWQVTDINGNVIHAFRP